MAPNMPSATSILSAYTAFAASIMVVKTMLNEVRNIANQVIPQTLQEKMIVKVSQLLKIRFTDEEILTINISKHCDSLTKNEVYEAAHTYLSTKINHSNKRLKLSKAPRDKDLSVSIDKGEVILDSFEGITLRWVKLVCDELSQGHMGHKVNMMSMELSFNKQHKEKVLGRYIPFVLETAKKIQDESRVVKLYKMGDPFDDPSSTNLHHPSTFDTLAMEPEVKRALIDDLDNTSQRVDALEGTLADLKAQMATIVEKLQTPDDNLSRAVTAAVRAAMEEERQKIAEERKKTEENVTAAVDKVEERLIRFRSTVDTQAAIDRQKITKLQEELEKTRQPQAQGMQQPIPVVEENSPRLGGGNNLTPGMEEGLFAARTSRDREIELGCCHGKLPKFHIYDFDLSRMKQSMDFRRFLVSTTNRSIIVIEDIDCSYTKFHNRQTNEGSGDDQTVPLAGLLNFIDGLWSSCGDERIIVFTTNYKERLDPALIRPGRMDVHIHMSYLTFGGFKILSSNYLNISSHALFAQIEELLKEVQVTPAEAAQELMKSDDIDEVLQGFVQLLLKKEKGKQVQENLQMQIGTEVIN
uniref:Uncharacterized protein n=1 Tax=Chenopodium quinoa TaxID=63459 RepID=A0A803MNK2_CHEQI